ncbi:MAG: hypothetical protein HQL41_13715 [Alphaproteobacteria bacterium]|nr:hypothetical protein [Alphaproteobacteria bacterium]
MNGITMKVEFLARWLQRRVLDPLIEEMDAAKVQSHSFRNHERDRILCHFVNGQTGGRGYQPELRESAAFHKGATRLRTSLAGIERDYAQRETTLGHQIEQARNLERQLLHVRNRGAQMIELNQPIEQLPKEEAVLIVADAVSTWIANNDE